MPDQFIYRYRKYWVITTESLRGFLLKEQIKSDQDAEILKQAEKPEEILKVKDPVEKQSRTESYKFSK